MKKFKIRASAIHEIMGQPRLKKDKEAGELSQTAKTYCKEWLKEQVTGKRSEFTSKYTDKGNLVEDESIDFIAEYLGLGYVIKNTEYKENEYITGTCDVKLKNLIIDAKNSYTLATFPMFEDNIPDKKYIGQVQGYMDLYEKDKAKVIYTLMNTPDFIIEREINSYCWNNNIDKNSEEYNDVTEHLYKWHTYDNLTDDQRIKIYSFDKDQKFINKVYEQVLKCRKYIDTLITKC